jgi:hypothetical protein
MAATFWELLPAIIVFVILSTVGVAGYILKQRLPEMQKNARESLKARNLEFSDSGLKLGMKDVSNEQYLDNLQRCVFYYTIGPRRVAVMWLACLCLLLTRAFVNTFNNSHSNSSTNEKKQRSGFRRLVCMLFPTFPGKLVNEESPQVKNRRMRCRIARQLLQTVCRS